MMRSGFLCCCSRSWKPQEFSVRLIVVLLIVVVGTGSARYEGKLRFNSNGEFKILQISDSHYANGKDTPCTDVLPSQLESCSDLNTTDYLRRFIAAENPDLIVFTGNLLFFFFFFCV